MPYKGTIEVISGLKQANNQNFALASTHDIWADEPDKRLDEVINDIVDGESGLSTKADKADTVLTTYLSRGRKANTSIGTGSFAFGYNVTASGNYSHGEGMITSASAAYAHAEGNLSVASSEGAHAEGYWTSATGNYAHSEGSQASALAEYAHAEGQGTIASGSAQHAEGKYNVENSSHLHIVGSGTSNARANAYALDSTGTGHYKGDVYTNCQDDSTGGKKLATEEYVNTADALKADKADTVLDTTLSRGRKANTTVGDASFAFGTTVEASGSGSHAEGLLTKATSLVSHAEGSSSAATGTGSHAEGHNTTASGNYSHAEGNEYIDDRNPMQVKTYKGEASGDSSHVEGAGNHATALASHAEGAENNATSFASHVEGFTSNATNEQAHAEGYSTRASGVAAHSEGSNTIASGNYSHAEGLGTKATIEAQHAEGKYNVESATMLHIVGNGVSAVNRSNAFAIDATGNGYFKGDAYVGCDAASANGNKVATEGYVNTADALKADKTDTVLTTTLSRGRSSSYNTGTGSFAFGENVSAEGDYSHAEGYYTIARSNYAHAEGSAYIDPSSGLRYTLVASGVSSHAEGEATSASGEASHAEGHSTSADGFASHAEGKNTTANADYSHVSGVYNVADSYDDWPEYQVGKLYYVGDKVKVTVYDLNLGNVSTGYICNRTHAYYGGFNEENWDAWDKKMNYVEIVGNGTGYSAKSNARALDWDGNEYLKGDIYVECNSSSGNGKKLATEQHVQTNYASLASPAFTGTPTAPTAVAGTNTTQIATTEFVMGTFASIQGMSFKGTIGTGGTISSLPAQHQIGWTYVVISPATYAGQQCEAGDMIVCVANGSVASDADWDVVKTNNSGAVTGPTTSVVNHIATFNGTNGKTIKDSGYTIETSVPANAVFTDTTYENKAAASGGTDVSLVTTGDKYNWNGKADATDTVLNTTLSRGRSALSTVGTGSFAFGNGVSASGEYSHAEGNYTSADGKGSHAEGNGCLAEANYAHAEGSNYSVSASGTITEYTVSAAGIAAHAEGQGTHASNAAAHSEGRLTTASGEMSHAEGYYTIAAGSYQHVEGRFNVSDSNTYTHIVGNGTADNNRSNAYALSKTGDGRYMGDLYVGCNANSTGGNKVATEQYVQDNVYAITNAQIDALFA